MRSLPEIQTACDLHLVAFKGKLNSNSIMLRCKKANHRDLHLNSKFGSVDFESTFIADWGKLVQNVRV